MAGKNIKQQSGRREDEFTYRPNVPVNKKTISDAFKPAEKPKEKEEN